MTAKVSETSLFVSGENGYHTLRIPALVASNKGTLLAICEGRRNSFHDDGDIDLVVKRSFDQGQSWGEMQLIWHGDEETSGNPCPVVDRDTGIIWLPFCRNSERVFMTSSRDDGATWSAPEEITASVMAPSWNWYATGPGHGIQLESGRLLIPCDHREPDMPNRTSRSHVICSDDQGATWKLGGTLDLDTNECEAVECPAEGTVYMSMRSFHGSKRRACARSADGGDTWSEVELDEALVEPVCQASIVRFSDGVRHDRSRVLFSNPASESRERMTVRVSYDECRSWTAGKLLHQGPSAYSSLCVAHDMTICCLYERGVEGPFEELCLARFGLEWLTDGVDCLEV